MKTKTSLLLSILLYSISFPVLAHEYWLEPNNFIIDSEEKIETNIKVGQLFNGNNYAYIPSQIKSANLYIDNKKESMDQRLGDYPAFTFNPKQNGLHILAVETNHFTVSYKAFDDFKQFVTKQDLSWTINQHRQRQLPEKSFIEAYKRFAKTLIIVGTKRDGTLPALDKKLGLEFEMVIKTDLTHSADDKVVAELWWRDQKLPDYQIRVFSEKNSQVKVKVLRTDQNGQVSFGTNSDTKYLLSAVQMITPEKQLAEKNNAIWESLWTSLTFRVAQPKSR
ncbi:MAG: DUF4198 domain-containing protein [Gammaproteobacteria bacterium]|nr:DUF4198 domain-containing protein [Gammaproteobacteria bacterium]